MNLTSEVLSNGMGAGKELFAGASGALVVAGAAFKAVARVPEGYRGVRTRLGRAHRKRGEQELYGIVTPGYYPIPPFTHTIKLISIQDRSSVLPQLQVSRPEEGQHLVDASIIWNVSPEGDSPYKALFCIADEAALTQTVIDLCASGLRETMTELPRRSITLQDEVEGSVRDKCSNNLGRYGVELSRLNLISVTETLGEMILRAGAGQGTLSLGSLVAAPGAIPGF